MEKTVFVKSEKRKYEKPQMLVFQLRAKTSILQASGEKPDYIPEEW